MKKLINYIKAFFVLPKFYRKHYYRLEKMTADEVIILYDYTDEQIERYGVNLLVTMTNKLFFIPDALVFLDRRTVKTLADSVVHYQKALYGNKLQEYKTIKKIIENEVF